MPNFRELTDEVINQLQGHSLTTPKFLTLGEDLTLDDSTLALSGDAGVTRGVIEIDDELIYLDGRDAQSFRMTIPAWGRGYQGSQAVEHLAGSRVTVGPRFPRHAVKRKINQAIQGVYPQLFSVGIDVSQTSDLTATYPLPFDADKLISASWFDEVNDRWVDIRRFRIDGAVDEHANRLVTLGTYVCPGNPLKFVYRRPPALLADDFEDFVEKTGLPDGADDVISTRVQAELITGVDLSSKQFTHAEQSNRAELVPTGSPLTSARFLMASYLEKLNSARERLLSVYPIRASREW